MPKHEIDLKIADPIETDLRPTLEEKVDEFFSIFCCKEEDTIIIENMWSRFRKHAVQKLMEMDVKKEGYLSKKDILTYFANENVSALDIVRINDSISFFHENPKKKLVRLKKSILRSSSKNIN